MFDPRLGERRRIDDTPAHGALTAPPQAVLDGWRGVVQSISSDRDGGLPRRPKLSILVSGAELQPQARRGLGYRKALTKVVGSALIVGSTQYPGRVAQLVEQGIENPRVGGSIPSPATIEFQTACSDAGRFLLPITQLSPP
jgi:hypothetical protein